MVKSVVFGWLKNLEQRTRVRGSKRKTVLYWRRMIREAGWDMTTIGSKASDRKGWKAAVKERMSHLEKWDNSKGKKWEGEPIERNVVQEMEFVFVCDKCGKVCRSKGGLTNHRRTMHEKSDLKKRFPCKKCNMVFERDANLRNHMKICYGEEVDGDRQRCGNCRKWLMRKSMPKHRKKCGMNAETLPNLRARKYVAKVKPCPSCGRELSATNMSRHMKICQ